eukprot:m.37587 g.37587  ORF g.37587 m.37587 type:complete len:439 (-) comp17712_c0_seq1:62-1378(-)
MVESNAAKQLRRIVLMCAIALDCVGVGMTYPIMPALLQSKTTGATFFGGVQSIASISGLFASSLIGRISDVHGRKIALVMSVTANTIGFLIFIGSVYMSNAPTANVIPGIANAAFVLAALGRVVTNIGHASIGGPANAAMLDDEPVDKTKQASSETMGRSMGMIGLGFAVGSATCGWLSKSSTYLPLGIAAFSAFVSLIGVLITVPSNAHHARSHVNAKHESSMSPSVHVPLSTLVVEAFSDSQIRILLIMQLLVQFSFRMFVSTAPLYITQTLHYDTEELGYFLSFAGWSFAFMAFFIVPVMINVAPRTWLLPLAFFSNAIGRYGLAVASLISPTATIIASYSFIGFGQALSYTMIAASMADIVQADRRGLMLGLLASCHSIASMIVPVFAGAIYDLIHPAAPAIVAGTLSSVGCALAIYSSVQDKSTPTPTTKKVD